MTENNEVKIADEIMDLMPFTYQNISKSTQEVINDASDVFKPVMEKFKEQIIGMNSTEISLLTLEYIETLHCILCECRIRNIIKPKS